MQHIKLKTNIKCDGCIKTVTPFLEKVAGLENWSVDLTDPSRILTADLKDNTAPEEILQALAAAGYSGERIN